MVGEICIFVVLLMVFQLLAPALYRAMVKPRPGSDWPLKGVVLVVKKMSARSSRVPKARAHQASEVPHPSQVPLFEVGSMVVVRSAAALRASASVRASRVTGLGIMAVGCC